MGRQSGPFLGCGWEGRGGSGRPDPSGDVTPVHVSAGQRRLKPVVPGEATKELLARPVPVQDRE